MKGKFFFVFLMMMLFSNAIADQIDQKLDNYIKKKSENIGLIEIERERPIDQTTYLYVKFALDYFKKKNVSFIILHLNTPGGEVFAASGISKLLKDIDTNDKIPVIAFIDDWAISAGAMLAYSSRFIAVTNTSSMGAAEPVIMTKDKMESASEKINSALRSEFSNLASFYDRDPDIAQAMVDKDIVLVKRGEKIIRLQADSEIEKSDQIITSKGKLLTLDSKALINLGIADFLIKTGSVMPLTDKEIKEGVWPATKSKILSYPFFEKFHDAKIIAFKDWKISFFSFLTHPAVVSILFFAMIICAYIEFSTPGFGIFGSIAIISLMLILLGSFAAYTINWLEIIILSLGVLLLLLEIFVIPGFGVTGILGIILTLLGLIIITLPNFPDILSSFDKNSFSADLSDIVMRTSWILTAIVIAAGGIAILTRFFIPRFLKRSSLIHQGQQEGYVAGYLKEELPQVGDKGIAYTLLRPSGKIEVNGKIMDAMAEIGFINRGEAVIITALYGDKILVRKI